MIWPQSCNENSKDGSLKIVALYHIVIVDLQGYVGGCLFKTFKRDA